MGVERRHLVDLGERELHRLGERRHVVRREAALGILDQMQMLDQQVAPPRPVAEQRAHAQRRGRADLAPLGLGPRPGAGRTGVPICANHARAFRHDLAGLPDPCSAANLTARTGRRQNIARPPGPGGQPSSSTT